MANEFTEAVVRQTVLETISDVMACETSEIDDALLESCDSLDLYEIVMELESFYDIELQDGELETLTVDRLVEVVLEKVP